MAVLPGVLLALALAISGAFLAEWLGADLLGLPRSPISPIMMAILLGMLLRNTLMLPAWLEPGIRFSLVRILRAGIVLLGIRLGLAEAGAIGMQGLPIIIGCVAAALILVTWLSRRIGLGGRLGTLIAAGTGICGATAIVALSPTIRAKADETAYAIACITLFGVAAMLAYPFLAHALLDGDALKVGLFLGTSVHETAQVAGAGLVYQQYFGSAEALNVATVTKLVRNLGMLVVIPLLGIWHHRSGKADGSRPGLLSMVPLFVVGFALMSLLRTLGDMTDPAFGFLNADAWGQVVSVTREAAEVCLGVAMAAVGLGTRLAGLREIGFKPLGVGLFSAVLVGGVSWALIQALV
ncbi:MAG: putative sulfate exporter family transporter [Xanthomonadales bacterium]|nr:putative sulfate exporter family transporter [Xanthomonadales bacterium]